MNTYINFLIFITTTISYYLFFKPTIKQSDTMDPVNVQNYTTTNYYYMFIYFMIVLVGQLVINILTVIAKCGSSSFKNLMLALVFTIVPWTLIFGVMIVVLLIYPSMKKGFADVVGYLFISGKAHEYISAISSSNSTIANKFSGKPEIFINVLTPFNFNSYFNDLTKGNQLDNELIQKTKDDLFKLIVNKDNIGEIMWIIYTGVLLIAIVQYYITNNSCSNDKLTLQDNYKKYIEIQEEKQNTQSPTTYETA
jgi:hypothetical protein